MSNAIPTIYYHSVGDHPAPRPWSFLSTPVKVFDAQMEYLTRAGFHFVDFESVHAHLRGEKRLPPKSVFLHFDDGFLDNYVFAWPIAKKYGVRFTVFVSPEFVDPRPDRRPTLDDVRAGRVGRDELTWWGYLSWNELRAMQASGLVDVQSHAMTHTWRPASDRIIDYHHPGDAYYWLHWNRTPAGKPFWLTEYDDESVPLGVPVYEHEKALVARAFTPDDERLERTLREYVAEHGGPAFFETPDWRERLHRVRRSVAPRIEGRYETLDERHARVLHELAGSKRCIEDQLDKPVRLLVWPGGATNDRLVELAREVGYAATTKGSMLNLVHGDPSRIRRGAGWYGGSSSIWLQKAYLRSQLDRLSGARTIAGGVNSTLRGLRDLSRWVRRWGRGRSTKTKGETA